MVNVLIAGADEERMELPDALSELFEGNPEALSRIASSIVLAHQRIGDHNGGISLEDLKRIALDAATTTRSSYNKFSSGLEPSLEPAIVSELGKYTQATERELELLQKCQRQESSHVLRISA